ncbi:TetR/AcrR family transcriptional regulator [Sphaerisporangium corydalis]|uniref:TetR/AcrR family transcriptional regulator n=1 Tax=Sphaerisporangium corydalis TaxID=1441875 RepID=A0ABV9EP66_9ACTN|nr:TetR/AcrR family transcriptional regulator [Sphaerisporangium corydalis]
MVDEPGFRERKKQRTKRALVEAALRLFDEQGYEETTLDQIAAAADISRRTFFSYFPAKEDVLFLGMEERVEGVLRGIAGRRPEEAMVDVLVRAAEEVAGHAWGDDLAGALEPVELRLLLTVPALQARALYRLSLAEARIAEALRAAFPGELDPITAVAVVGAVVRAGTAAAMAALRNGEPGDQVRAATRRAVRIVGQGLRHTLGPRPEDRSAQVPSEDRSARGPSEGRPVRGPSEDRSARDPSEWRSAEDGSTEDGSVEGALGVRTEADADQGGRF